MRGREGASRERGIEGARERGSEGARERGRERGREREREIGRGTRFLNAFMCTHEDKS